MAGCEKGDTSATPVPPHATTAPTSIRTFASVVPAATDIVIEMGAGEQIVGVSNYEPKTPELAKYPRIGDYHVIDWEQLSTIRPNVLAIPRPKQEMVEVFQQRANALKIDLIDVHMDRLDDIYPVITRLGDAIGQRARADQLLATMQADLDAVRRQVEGKPRVRTLIALNHSAQFVVGPKNYLDDILTIAGGTNVVSGEKDYPEIDRETLLQLDPDAILLFLPEAPPQVVEAATAFFRSLPQLKATRTQRIYVHTERYLMLPTARARNVAKLIANDLHPLTPAATTTTTVAK